MKPQRRKGRKEKPGRTIQVGSHPDFPLRSLRLCGYFSLVLIILCLAAKKRPEPPPPLTVSIPSAAAPESTTDLTFHGAAPGDPVGLWTSFPAEATALPSEGA